MFIKRAMCGLTYVTVVALCSSCSLQKYLELWLAILNEGGRSVSVVKKSPKIPRIEINKVHLYQHDSLFMHNKQQYTWCGPDQLPFLTWSSSSFPLGTTSTLRSPLGPRRIQQYPWSPVMCSSGSTERYPQQSLLNTRTVQFFRRNINGLYTGSSFMCKFFVNISFCRWFDK
jgi:hypothetical protein